MGRKFAVQFDTNTFNKIMLGKAYEDKYSKFSLKFQHNPHDGSSTVYFGEDAPEEEIMEHFRAEVERLKPKETGHVQ